MKTYTVATDSGDISYTDTKRYLWMASLAYTLIPFLGIGAHSLFNEQAWLAAPLIVAYVIGPILDWWLGEDKNNPPEEIVPLLEADPYYRLLPMLTVPLHFISLIGSAYWAGTQELSWWGFSLSLQLRKWSSCPCEDLSQRTNFFMKFVSAEGGFSWLFRRQWSATNRRKKSAKTPAKILEKLGGQN